MILQRCLVSSFVHAAENVLSLNATLHLRGAAARLVAADEKVAISQRRSECLVASGTKAKSYISSMQSFSGITRRLVLF